MTNYNDGKWHGWNGGECPVHPKSRVDIAGSWGITRSKLAGDVSWTGGVIAFRVVKEHREPREFWIDTDGVLHTVYMPYCIHVREVIDNG